MWMILERKKERVSVRDLELACQCGIIWETKPDKEWASAYFDKRREKLIKIEVSIQAKKGGKRK